MGLRPIAVIDYDKDNTASIYTVHTDHLGTPQQVSNETQQIVWQGEYDAFGNVTVKALPHGLSQDIQAKQQGLSFSLFNKAYAADNAKSETFEFNLRFAGQYKDSESGYYYNWHRYYNPETGRYLTSDPIGLNGGLNTYGYAGQNPISAVDPWGLVVWKGTYLNGSFIPGYGVVKEAYNLWSECVNGQKAFARVDARGVAKGYGLPWTYSGGKVELNDGLSKIDVTALNGVFYKSAWGVGVGLTIGGSLIFLGKASNESITDFTKPSLGGGVDGGYFVATGTSKVLRSNFSTCTCEGN